MDQKRVLLNRLFNRKRIDVTPNNYLKKVKVVAAIMSLTVVLLIAAYLFFSGITFLSLGVSAGLLLLNLVLLMYFRKKIKSAAVKGDSLILNSLTNRSYVTSLRSVKKVHTISIFGIQWTTLHYKLDGVKRSSIIINSSAGSNTTPEKTIKKAIELNKKQKANRKPGSVITRSA